MIEPRQNGTGAGKCCRQNHSPRNIDPEEIAREPMIDFFPLHDGFGNPHLANPDNQHAERGDHGHHTEIGRRQKASQNHRRNDLDRKRETAGKQRDPNAAYSAFPHGGAMRGGVGLKQAVRIERPDGKLLTHICFYNLLVPVVVFMTAVR